MSEFPIIRGDTPTIRIGPIRRGGDLVDLTGAAGKLTAKNALADADGDAVFQRSATFDTAEALAQFTLVEGDTSSLEPGTRLIYDIEIREQDGTVTTFPETGPGVMRILPDVTRG